MAKNGVLILLLSCIAALPARAEGEMVTGLFTGARAPLFTQGSGALIAPPAMTAVSTGPSLFAGRASGGLFAPVLPRTQDLRAEPFAAPDQGSDVDRIRHLIGLAESRRYGYDAVQHGAKRPPQKLPTDMTLGEVFAWIKATPGQPHAIGRYQFIPKTLARVVTELDLGPKVRFSPAVQDRLADVLLREAGLEAFRARTLSRHGFMNNLAKIWAGLPTSSGKSHYHGYAGNRATITWEQFDREMAKITET
ncbi:hypothetical protein [Celeribacter arenosi]|uniref:Uncharacterized protein n=1 Tax=Celeribacter arenosi TaxID=792649 RepID=A0ABP7K0U8_9RHOB